jgi:hypothetical protein
MKTAAWLGSSLLLLLLCLCRHGIPCAVVLTDGQGIPRLAVTTFEVCSSAAGTRTKRDRPMAKRSTPCMTVAGFLPATLPHNMVRFGKYSTLWLYISNNTFRNFPRLHARPSFAPSRRSCRRAVFTCKTINVTSENFTWLMLAAVSSHEDCICVYVLGGKKE